jgi:hypothetical protein
MRRCPTAFSDIEPQQKLEVLLISRNRVAKRVLERGVTVSAELRTELGERHFMKRNLADDEIRCGTRLRGIFDRVFATPEGQRLYEAGRSGWVPGQHFDWVSDFDSWDRCVTRGFPASMYPFRYNNGIRVWQAPGYMTIELEMMGTRVVKIYPSKAAAQSAKWDERTEAWLGNSRGWWEGKTLVIETTNIVHGDSATHDVAARSSSPLNMATQHVPPFNTIPMSDEAMTLERLTMTDANTIVHELTYSDPVYYTAPWTTRIEWSRNQGYQFFEYACHEGNYAIRDYINASRAHRKGIAEGTMTEETGMDDSRNRFAEQFDFDPVVTAPRFPPGPPPPPPSDEDEDEAEGG